MTPLHPSQLHVIRIRYAIAALIVLGALAFLDANLARDGIVRGGVITAVAALAAMVTVFLLPRRRLASWGYRLEEDELTVRHGLTIRRMTIVPFGRVQHIDLAQGPIERPFGLATLVLNTAGTRGAAVRLPGLWQSDAEAMRDRIRAKIREDLV